KDNAAYEIYTLSLHDALPIFAFSWNINYIDGQKDPDEIDDGEVIPGLQVGGYATNDVQVVWSAPWNAKIAVGAMNVGDRYPELRSEEHTSELQSRENLVCRLL